MPVFGWRVGGLSVLITLCLAVQSSLSALPACTFSDYKAALLACDQKTLTRSYVTYHAGNCDSTLPGAVQPRRQTGLPCVCPPGQGIKLHINDTFSCQPCLEGDFSIGGELITDWRYWMEKYNDSGAYYDLMVSCGDPFQSSPCKTWMPAGNNEYLISGQLYNATTTVRSPDCYSHAVMDARRYFGGTDNYVSFSYQVDAKLCIRGAKYCASGLYFFVDGKPKPVMHSDFQFMWQEFKYPLEKGFHTFKWVFRKSCSRVASLNVAYLKHLSFVGTYNSLPKCGRCPIGTFSNKTGTSECSNCLAGEYQDEIGKLKCKPCAADKYSRVGDHQCFPLPNCTLYNYAFTPDPVEKCYQKGDQILRHQKVEIIRIPGSQEKICRNATTSHFPTEVPCQCRAGYFLAKAGDTFSCQKCKPGKYGTGNTTSCEDCSPGHAIIPGLHFNEWSTDDLPSPLMAECSGANCEGNGWVQSGSFIRTKRIAGNFETKLEIVNLTLDYFAASVTFYCSVYCNVGEGRSARSKNCYLRTIVMRDSEVIRDKDCVTYNIMTARNGTIRKHYMKLSKPGNYTFRWLFHHGDDFNTTDISYEARIYNISISGTSNGSASSCSICPAGSHLPTGKVDCQQCPAGTFSNKGASSCSPCTNNSYSDKPGSSSCIPCGAGTVVDDSLTDCNLNGCQFSPAAGVVYDFMPLGRVGGSMREVKRYKKNKSTWYETHYYVNLCTKRHDNSSCYVSDRERDEKGQWKVIGQKMLPVYACKRWSFSQHHAYSLGSTMGFKARKEPLSGVTVVLSEGYSCYSRHLSKLIPAKTEVDMICDLGAGEGTPGPINNLTAVEYGTCYFKMGWRSKFACPVCQQSDYKEVRTPCTGGYTNVSYIPTYDCLPSNASVNPGTPRKIKCQVPEKTPDNSALQQKTKSLLAIVIVCVIISCLLSAVVAFILCKNRRLRRQLFTFHPTMKELQGENDYQELVADN